MKSLVIIPARYASTRFPGKPLALVKGVPMIVRTCMQAAKASPDLIVATDDERIRRVVEEAGFRAVMTPSACASGTDRVFRAFQLSGYSEGEVDVIINVQGDEPFINPEQIRQLVGIFESDKSTQLATLIREFDPALGFEALGNPNLVKVVRDDDGHALYFSRSVIPFVRNHPEQEWLAVQRFYSHIGIYGYTPEALKLITSLPQSSLEKSESLEQLRWLQNGLTIRTAVSNCPNVGIDTPEDLEFANNSLL